METREKGGGQPVEFSEAWSRLFEDFHALLFEGHDGVLRSREHPRLFEGAFGLGELSRRRPTPMGIELRGGSGTVRIALFRNSEEIRCRVASLLS